MENLIFSLNATVPVFAMIVLGMLFKKLGIIDDVFASKMNKFVFLIPLPVLLFKDLATLDFKQIWDTKFVLFCFFITIFSILIVTILSFLLKNKKNQGEFIQASYRSSAALLGIALIQNVYGKATMAPLMIIGSVPLYNIMAVVVLSFFSPERKGISKEMGELSPEVLLVLDATTGQNAINQVKAFKQETDVTGLVLTKLDGSSKGGVVVGIVEENKIPVKFIGVGEQIDDMEVFNSEDFAKAII